MTSHIERVVWVSVLGCVMLLFGGCAGSGKTKEARTGDEIVVCGQMFHTGAPVVLWTDPDGYNAYSTVKRFGRPPAAGEASAGVGPRYGSREAILPTRDQERVRRHGWTLDLLREHVDQFVIHYDACGTSRACFRILHDVRGLSVHFMVDLDGTIYQTLDVKERAWHATTSNDRSVGVEIANIGSFPMDAKDAFDRWYVRDGGGWRVKIPPDMGDGGIRTRGFVARPARDGPVVGEVQGQVHRMHDLMPQQYDSLVKLTAALCIALPRIACDYPRDARGALETRKLSDERLKVYRGLIGHYHIQDNKADPGPAFQWERVVEGARRRLEATTAARVGL